MGRNIGPGDLVLLIGLLALAAANLASNTYLNTALKGVPDAPRVWSFAPWVRAYLLRWVWSGVYKTSGGARLAKAVWVERAVEIANVLFVLLVLFFVRADARLP